TLTRTTWAELDEVIVPLRKWNQSYQKMELEPARHLRRFVAHASDHQVNPLVRRKLATSVAIVINVECRDLNRLESINPKGVLAARFFVDLKAQIKLAPHSAHQQAFV